MVSLRRLAVVFFVSGSLACTSAQATFITSPSHAAPSRFDPLSHSPHPMLGVAIDVPGPVGPVRPQTELSTVVALYERGDPPSSNPVVTGMYRKVCADPERSRARRNAYDRGDDIARRQDCYCADDIPCSVNRDCTDLVVCYPQLAQRDVGETGNASF